MENPNDPETLVAALDGDELATQKARLTALGQWGAYSATTQCIEKSGSCDAYWKCLVPAGAETCEQGTFVAECDGSAIVGCGSVQTGIGEYASYVVRTECDLLPWDSACLPDGGTGEEPGPGCSNPFCREQETYAGCRGTVAAVCEPGEYGFDMWVEDCAVESMQCAASTGTCVDPKGYDCGGGQGLMCDGPFIQYCRDGRLHSTRDCREADSEFACIMDDDMTVCGMPKGGGGCAEHGKTWCEGSTFKLCLRGKELAFDCADLDGFACKDGWCAPRGG